MNAIHLEKSNVFRDWYFAHVWANGKFYNGAGKNRSQAISRLFAKLKVAKIGNWTK